jgi:transposase
MTVRRFIISPVTGTSLDRHYAAPPSDRPDRQDQAGWDRRRSARDNLPDERSRRLSKLSGVGPVIATALVAAVDDGRQFRSGRELAAWIGLVPRQYTTGGKPHLGGIGRRANHYLRRQMIHGARSVVMRVAKHVDRRSEWLKRLTARRGFNRTIIALANKTARIAWALLTRNEDYVAAKSANIDLLRVPC